MNKKQNFILTHFQLSQKNCLQSVTKYTLKTMHKVYKPIIQQNKMHTFWKQNTYFLRTKINSKIK